MHLKFHPGVFFTDIISTLHIKVSNFLSLRFFKSVYRQWSKFLRENRRKKIWGCEMLMDSNVWFLEGCKRIWEPGFLVKFGCLSFKGYLSTYEHHYFKHSTYPKRFSFSWVSSKADDCQFKGLWFLGQSQIFTMANMRFWFLR